MRPFLNGWYTGIKFSIIHFADNTTLIAANEDEMFEIIQSMEEVSVGFGREIKRPKLKL